MKKLNQTTYFVIVLLVVFTITFSILYAAGLVPESFKIIQSTNKTQDKDKNNQDDDNDVDNDKDQNPVTTKTIPDHITISKIDVDANINQPSSVDVGVLDEALRSGAVYYPGSGTIEGGNIFVFGHSTNWQVVQNPAYKTFNGLDKLVSGDEIVLESGNKKFLYKVTEVKMVDADTALVEFDNGGKSLTISTCNTFGAKQDRWVVTAKFSKQI